MRKPETGRPKLRLQPNGIIHRQTFQWSTTTIKTAQISSTHNVWPATNQPFKFKTLTHDEPFSIFFITLPLSPFILCEKLPLRTNGQPTKAQIPKTGTPSCTFSECVITLPIKSLFGKLCSFHLHLRLRPFF